MLHAHVFQYNVVSACNVNKNAFIVLTTGNWTEAYFNHTYIDIYVCTPYCTYSYICINNHTVYIDPMFYLFSHILGDACSRNLLHELVPLRYVLLSLQRHAECGAWFARSRPHRCRKHAEKSCHLCRPVR